MKSEKIKLLILFALTNLVLSQSFSAQHTKAEPCPEATVFGPSLEPKVAETGTYSAVVDTKGVPQNTSLEWFAIEGEVVSGQGTSEVWIRRTGQDFAVGVTVKGVRRRCENVFRLVRNDNIIPEATLLDRIEGVVTGSDRDRIKNFADEMQSKPKMVYWVIVGHHKTAESITLAERERLLIDTLKKYHHFGRDIRLTFVNVVDERNYTEFWRTTPNAKPPILETNN